MPILRLLLLSVLLLARLNADARTADPLRSCWEQQVQPLQTHYLALRYQEILDKLEHSQQPWQATHYTSAGQAWCRADSFRKTDTLRQGTRTYFSQTQLTPATLLFQDYGDQKLTPVTPETFQEYALQAARYNPALLIQAGYARRLRPAPDRNREVAEYAFKLNRTQVTLFIGTADRRLRKATLLSYDELHGDVLTTYNYADYTTLGKLAYPRTITISKINGRLTDKVTIDAAGLAAAAPDLLTAPANYTLVPAPAKTPPISVSHHGAHLHFIELRHTDDKVLVVEFDTFLLVAEAPLNSENGELIIAEARKIAPTKPIRYFVAGHYHPHYLGGMRPFVHRGATVITTVGDLPYVQYLATAPHTLRPDSLQLRPRPLNTILVEGSYTVAENGFQMQIYHIGGQSQHTNDYLVYYFPTEKLLFQDDLAWIPRQGAIGKASPRQAGLYQAIKDRGLVVDTIIQSWPVQDYGVKTVIPFHDLEQAMQAK